MPSRVASPDNAAQNFMAKAAMAKVIKFYVPTRFRRKVVWVPSHRRGKMIEFPVQIKKSA